MASILTTLKENNQENKTVSEKNLNRNEKVEYDSTWLKGTSADLSPTVKCNRSAPAIKTDFSDPIYKKLSRINGKINSMPMHELVNNLRALNLETR